MKSFAVAAIALFLGAGTADAQYYTHGGYTHSYPAYTTYSYPAAYTYPATYTTYSYPNYSYVAPATSGVVVTSGYTPVQSAVVTSAYTPIETTSTVLTTSGTTYYTPLVEPVYYTYPASYSYPVYSNPQPARRFLGRWLR